MSMHYRTITEVAPALKARAVSSYDLTRHLLDRIETYNAILNAFVTVAGKEALEAARKADQELEQGHWRGPLHGVPVAIKDNIATRGIRTTCGSPLFKDWVPDRDATVVKRLKDAGAIILGKTGTHELAYGTTSMFGAVRNPWDTSRDPGGSSGGSAVAVAAGLAFAALGTDTACSIRHPAHACGVVGFKPSLGLVSTAGVQPLVRTMDHVGTLSRSVADAALVTAAIAGHDPADVYSCNVEMEKRGAGSDGVAGIRLGVIRPFFFDGDTAIMTVVDQAIERLERSGATLVPIDGSAGREPRVEPHYLCGSLCNLCGCAGAQPRQF